ncbi:serine hydrolase domain-containing protein [Polyangium sp. 6x1]|uniref:serine hydrolase domain-containing protein n=1 Tax=Polyangium sp. 6x1 TaxID=3042689 RepID=UPI0024830D0F|nr:serine hydrolase domain-containing protein [Polyangium sp. 6x1]MDI1442745.1 serine hydrolase domain-containing protein [Polyangium sp. 6x1]
MHTIPRGPLTLAAFLLFGCATQNQPRSVNDEGSRREGPVDDYIHAVMEKNHVPGVAVAIVRQGKVERISTYGAADLESEAKVGPETAFQIASATKVFTGTLVMLLVQEGTIRLDDPISKYLPDAPEAWKAITVRHLAAHASGLKDDPGDQNDAAASVAARYEAAKKAPLAYVPGERSEYALTDFVVLTHVLETVTGERFEELLKRRIFQPLGFSCTRFEHATQEGLARVADVIPRRATIYRLENGTQKRAWFLYPAHAYAAGGMFSCVKDLARWAVAMDEGTLLTPETQAVAATAFKLNDGRAGEFGVAFGVGRLRGQATFGHSGGGALADVLRVPDQKLSVIVLTNEQRLLPLLAPNIASMHMPPLPGVAAPGIPDADPALTAAHRAVVEGLLQGTLDAAAFAPSAKEQILPSVRSFGTPGNALQPPLRKLVLLEDRKAGEPGKRVYRAIYGEDTSLRWVFDLDAAGKILDFNYAWE